MKKRCFFISVTVVAILMLASFAVQASGNLTVSTDVFTGKCTVVTSFDDSANSPASIEVIPSNLDESTLDITNNNLQTALDKVLYFDQNNCDSSGKVTFSFQIKSSGEYVVRVHSMTNIGVALESPLNYTSFDDAEYIWNNLTSNSSVNFPKLVEILGIKDELILSMKTDESVLSVVSGCSSIGIFNKENAENFIKKVKAECLNIAKLRDLLSQVKSAGNTTVINSIVNISENAAILGVTQYMPRYNNLENTKIADSAVVGKTYLSASDFAKAFLAGIEKAEEAQAGNSIVQKPPANPSNNGSLGGSSLGSNVVIPSDNTQVSQVAFTDISDVPWASDAIIALYNCGIISGKSKNEFAPQDYITREEFVKIALGVAGIKPLVSETSFSDVEELSWYAPYVSAALSAGIVSGYSDTLFGVGEYITRQDVAVILDRVHKFTSTVDSIDFSDSNDVSEYAKSSVKRLSAVGVINGSEGRFMPKFNCTRAEAACMVYRMMSLMKEGK